MGQQTAFARATTRLPNTKPILRQFQDAMRLAVNRPMPDQRKMVFHLAERLAQQALDGDVAAMREVMYCLDGRPGISGSEEGTTVSFVVRLPAVQLDAEEWQAMANPRPAARIVDVEDAETHVSAESASDPELAVELAADPLAVEPSA